MSLLIQVASLTFPGLFQALLTLLSGLKEQLANATVGSLTELKTDFKAKPIVEL